MLPNNLSTEMQQEGELLDKSQRVSHIDVTGRIVLLSTLCSMSYECHLNLERLLEK
jgi:hypothetical protein